jgi:hypothetical protein
MTSCVRGPLQPRAAGSGAGLEREGAESEGGAPVHSFDPMATPTDRRRFASLLAVAVTIAGAGRLLALRGDLWLDEIWSLRLVASLGAAAEIWTRLHHDNNHPLNSLWLYALQPTTAEWRYRLLAWAMGTAAVALAGLAARRQVRALRPAISAAEADAAGILAALLVGGSYLMVHYASEARGYAPAVGFGLLALYVLLHGGSGHETGWASVYWLACTLALLSHLTAIAVLAGGLAYGAVRAWEGTGPWRDRALRLAVWHGPPWLLFAAHYLGFVRHMQIGGGPRHALVPVLGETAAYASGIPIALGPPVALPLLLAVVGFALALLWRRGGRAPVAFYTLAVLAAPALGLAAGNSTLRFPRYFVVNVAFALVLVAHALGWAWTRGAAWRAIAAAAAVLFVAGNAFPTARLVRDGRGQYRAVLRHIANASSGPEITVSSDHDFRNAMMIEHYRAAVGLEHTLRYVPVRHVPSRGVDWILLHRLDGEAPPGDVVADPRHNRYRLEAVAPHAALSGWHWFLYRRVDPAARP